MQLELGRKPAPDLAAAAAAAAEEIDLTAEEQRAIAVLAGSGLVPPLRLVARPVDPDQAGPLNWDHEPAQGERSPRRRKPTPRRSEGAA
ncbi:hypothetical protein [Kineosporia babensis]|uniref:Uncharacterized protein n=1 Tax=Kineosporia babensis TaxID=499548 RepID=A0A9X1ST80_9ACTN|nr:hypothetical protein [Kineosporia babensis]MCD5311544.1 hypothetical protein [Kineosporia babensis]